VIETDKGGFELLQSNIERNVPPQELHKINVKELIWGETKLENFFNNITDKNIDFIICSDLLYRDYLLSPLLSTLVTICQQQRSIQHETVVYIGYEDRKLNEDDFMKLCAEFFSVPKGV